MPFDVLLAPITYFFFNNDRPSVGQLNKIEKFFWRASISQRYVEGQNTKIDADIEAMDSIIDNDSAPDYEMSFTRASVRDQELRFGSSFAKTILCLYSTLSPKDIRTNELVALAQCFAGANVKQLHHLFPRKYLETLSEEHDYKTKIKPFANSISNVCLITALSIKLLVKKNPAII